MTETVKRKPKYTLFTAKALLWLILPIVIEQIFSTSLGLFDSMMISNSASGDLTSNAVSNVNYINNLIIQLFSAFATGGAIVTSQCIGSNDNENANKSAKQMLMLVILISVVIGALCLALNWPILKLCYNNVSAEVFGFQQTYLYNSRIVPVYRTFQRVRRTSPRPAQEHVHNDKRGDFLRA